MNNGTKERRMDATSVGNALAHYRLEAPLGSGGVGTVFLAQDTRLSRQVAVKVLPADRLDEQSRQRLRNEALTLSRLSHPNIAAVFDFGSQAEIDYLVMEYVPGTTLDVMLQRGPLESETVARLGVQLARGLAAAHACGIVHRDIKPGNVRVTPEGLLKILDFGVATFALPAPKAKTTAGFFDRTPALAGTIKYMAPERLRGGPADPRTDIFSAGALLYEMACGRPPFRDPQPIRLIESILSARRTRPSSINPRVDPALESVVLRALDPDPAWRFPRAADLADALEAVATRQRPPRTWSIGTVARWASKLASALLM
jgi:eukaryotic-like serine/threonine-protein kinase